MSDEVNEAKRSKRMKKSYDVENGVGTITFPDESSVSVDLSKLNANTVQYAALVGALYFVGAGLSGDEAKDEAAKRVAQVYEAEGSWGRVSGGTASANRPATIFEEALMQVLEGEWTLETLREKVEEIEASDPERMKAFRKTEQVQAAMTVIKQERAAEKAKAAKKLLKDSDGKLTL